MQDYITNYEEAVEYIYRIPRFNTNHSLEKIEYLLKIMGSPEQNMKIIHVAGTNGKGSACAYLAGLLQRAGLKTGLFTSPHLIDMRERIQINGRMISEELFLEAVLYVQQLFFREDVEYEPCFFDVLFLTGMYAFSKENVDILVLETGLGGRLDATNAVSQKSLTLITHIGLDHTAQLGDTLELIAAEKAGIMKTGVPCIIGAGNDAVLPIFLKKATEIGSTCRILNKEDYGCQRVYEKAVAFSYFSSYYGTIQIELRTRALYQIDNACLAMAGLEELIAQGIVSVNSLTESSIKETFAQTVWPGRMEEIMPSVYVDGAHNVDGIDAFLESVRNDGCTGKRILVFSAASDKLVREMAERINTSGLFDKVIITRLLESRAADVDYIYECFNKKAVIKADIPNALQTAFEYRQKKDYIYISGSLFLAGQVKRIMDID